MAKSAATNNKSEESSKSKRLTGQSRKNTANKNNSEQPLKQTFGETDKDFLERQRGSEQEQTQNTEKSQNSSLVQRGKNFTNKQVEKVKGYGMQKGNEALGKGANYVKEKGEKFLAQNPKASTTFSKARQIKEDYQNRMGKLKENTRGEPIKQRPGESSGEFRKRQKEQDDESPDNLKNRSLRDITKERIRTEQNKQLGTGNLSKSFLKAHPNLAKAAEGSGERAKAIQNKIAAIKNSNTSKRLNAIRQVKAKELIKKKVNDEVKKIKLEIAKAAARVVFQLVIYILGIIGAILLKLLVVAIVVVVIIVAVNYLCNNGGLLGATCSAMTEISKLLNWVGLGS